MAASPNKEVLDDFLRKNSSKNDRWGPSGHHHPAVLPKAGADPLFPPADGGSVSNAASQQLVREEVRQLLEAFLSRDQPVEAQQDANVVTLRRKLSASLPRAIAAEVKMEQAGSVTLPRAELRSSGVQAHERPPGAAASAWVPPRPVSYMLAVNGCDIPSSTNRDTSRGRTDSFSAASSLSSLEETDNNKGYLEPVKHRKKKSLYQRAKERLRMSLRLDQVGPASSAGVDAGSSKHNHSRRRPFELKVKSKKKSDADGKSKHKQSSPERSEAALTPKQEKKLHGLKRLPTRTGSLSSTLERLKSSFLRKTSRAEKSVDNPKDKPGGEHGRRLSGEGAAAPEWKQDDSTKYECHAGSTSSKVHRTETMSDKESTYKKVAKKLAKMADSYAPVPGGEYMELVESDGPPAATGLAAEGIYSVGELSIEKKLAAALRAKADQLSDSVAEPVEAIQVMLRGAVYSEFNRAVTGVIPREHSEAHQLAMVFRLAKSAIHLAGSGGSLAVQIKDYTVRYVEDRFAHWIFYGGGWDSMIEDSDFDVD